MALVAVIGMQGRGSAAAACAYAAPCLAPQIEGRGNGIKTNVVNCQEIAKALERPPECERLRLHRLPLPSLPRAIAPAVSASAAGHRR